MVSRIKKSFAMTVVVTFAAILTFANIARADQLAVITEAQAREAAELLRQRGKAILWCACCAPGGGGGPKELVFVSNAFARRWTPPSPNHNPNLFTVILEDTRGRTHHLDLAYVHVLRIGGLAHSVGRVLGLEHDPCTVPFDWFEVERAHTPAVAAQWDCGADENAGGAGSVTCVLYENRSMRISGSGRMRDFDLPPWYASQNFNTAVIEEGVTSIGNSVFFKSGVTSITIPSSVTHIGRTIFFDAMDFTEITIPNGVVTIADEAFWSTGLTAVNIPASVTSIGKDAFAHTPLATVTIDNCEGRVAIGENAFPVGASVTYTGVPVEDASVDPSRTLSFEISGTGAARVVNIFRRGGQIRPAELTIFGANDRVIETVRVSDGASVQARRQVGSWNLRDRRGWVVPNGTYHLRGTVVAGDCRMERVDLAVEVR